MEKKNKYDMFEIIDFNFMIFFFFPFFPLFSNIFMILYKEFFTII